MSETIETSGDAPVACPSPAIPDGLNDCRCPTGYTKYGSGSGTLCEPDDPQTETDLPTLPLPDPPCDDGFASFAADDCPEEEEKTTEEGPFINPRDCKSEKCCIASGYVWSDAMALCLSQGEVANLCADPTACHKGLDTCLESSQLERDQCIDRKHNFTKYKCGFSIAGVPPRHGAFPSDLPFYRKNRLFPPRFEGEGGPQPARCLWPNDVNGPVCAKYTDGVPFGFGHSCPDPRETGYTYQSTPRRCDAMCYELWMEGREDYAREMPSVTFGVSYILEGTVSIPLSHPVPGGKKSGFVEWCTGPKAALDAECYKTHDSCGKMRDELCGPVLRR